MSGPAALLDVDGTLVDSSYHHALAWSRAFREHDLPVPLWRIHRCIGMGGDQLVPALLGEAVERERGDALRQAWTAQFAPLRAEVAPLPGAHALLAGLRQRGRRIALASSAPREDLDHYLDLLDAHRLIDGATTASDVDATKPASDLIAAALALVGGGHAVMVGDAPYDAQAAAALQLPTLGLLTGGYAEAELRAAGVAAVFASPAELLERIDETPLGG